jgi:hypothetical protein
MAKKAYVNDGNDWVELASSNTDLSGYLTQSSASTTYQTKVENVDNTEIGYLNNASANIQTQLNSKSPSASPTFTGTVVLPSTTSIGTITSTELGYLDGVTSAIQTQLNNKLTLGNAINVGGNYIQFSATTGGTVYLYGPLGTVDGNLDLRLPILSTGNEILVADTTTQTLTNKTLASPTFTGTVSAAGINTTGDISGGGWVGGVTSDGAGRGLLVRQAAGDANNAIIQFTNNGVTAQRASITAGAGGQLSMNSTTAFWGCIQTNTVAGQAVVVTSDGQLRRTSSSEKYKNSIEDLNHDVADRVLDLRPVWFKANETNSDNKAEWSYVGLIAEEVAEVEPRLTLFKNAEIVYDDFGNQKFNEDGSPLMIELEIPEPEGVKYAELSVYLLDIIKREKARSNELEQRISDLENRLENL